MSLIKALKSHFKIIQRIKIDLAQVYTVIQNKLLINYKYKQGEFYLILILITKRHTKQYLLIT